MTHLEWLDMKFGKDIPAVQQGTGRKAKVVSSAVIAPTVKERLAELVFRNGGQFRVGGWGVKQVGIGIYGEVGLDAADAFDLVHLHGILVGFALADGKRQRVHDDVMNVLKDVWKSRGWVDE